MIRLMVSFYILLGFATTLHSAPKDLVNPLSSITHGVIVNDQGKPDKPTGEFVLKWQNYQLQSLVSQATKSQQAEINQKNKALVGQEKMTEAEQIYQNAVFILWMSETINPKDADTIKANNIALLTKYAKLNKMSLDTFDTKPSWVSASIWAKINNLTKLTFKPILGFLYKLQCRAAKVPIPPTWGDSKWVHVATNPVAILPSNTTFLDPTAYKTEVFSYTPIPAEHNGTGLCLAFPIIQNNGDPTYNALGIICQSDSTSSKPNASNSKACFWDNNGDTFKIGTKIPLTDFLSPTTIPILPDDNRCTECHAGENAFIVHPGTAIADAVSDFNSKSAMHDNWYKPILSPFWPQNPENPSLSDPALLDNNGCTSCHSSGNGNLRLPKIKGILPRDDLRKFCTFVLPNTLAKEKNAGFHGTMPPGDTRPYSMLDPDTQADIAALLAECKSITAPALSLPLSPADWGNEVPAP